MKVRYDLTSETGLGRLREVKYRVVLMDTCFIYEYAEELSGLANIETIKGCGILPAVCDFTDVELLHLSVKKRRGLISAEKGRDTCIAFIKTQFKTMDDVKSSLDMIPKNVRREIIKAYAGHKEESRFEDFALLTTLYTLASNDVSSGIATMDSAIIRAVYRMRGIGDLDLEVYRRPWAP